MSGSTTPRRMINCFECSFFYVTWEKDLPYGCNGHGFKSKQMPSIVVYSSSGEDCLLFKQKTSKKKS